MHADPGQTASAKPAGASTSDGPPSRLPSPAGLDGAGARGHPLARS